MDPRHLGLGEDGQVLVPPPGRRRLRERGGVHQVGRLEPLLRRLELPDEVLQLGALRPEVERELENGQGLAAPPVAQELPAAPLVHLRLVGRQPRRRQVVGLGLLGASVGGEQVGAPQAEEGIAGGKANGGVEHGQGLVELAAPQVQRHQRRPRLGVVGPEREQLPVPGHGLLGPVELPCGPGSELDGAGLGGELLGEPQELHLPARLVPDLLPGLRQRGPRGNPGRPGLDDGPKPSDRLVRPPPTQLLLGERQAGHRVPRLGAERALEVFPAPVQVLVLQPRGQQLGSRVARQELRRPARLA